MSAKPNIGRPTTHMEVEGELCKLFYNKFGKEALPLITRAFRDWGLVLGERLKAKIPQADFKTAVEAYLKPVMDREPPPEIISSSEDKVELKVYTCPFALKDAGQELCEAMMAMDRAILESIIGDDAEMELPRSVAAGDDHCLGIIKRRC